jgi:hypothetical protein
MTAQQRISNAPGRVLSLPPADFIHLDMDAPGDDFLEITPWALRGSVWRPLLPVGAWMGRGAVGIELDGLPDALRLSFSGDGFATIRVGRQMHTVEVQGGRWRPHLQGHG